MLGNTLLSISDANTTLSVSSLPKITLPSKVILPVACRPASTKVLALITNFLVGLISKSVFGSLVEILFASILRLSTASATALIC